MHPIRFYMERLISNEDTILFSECAIFKEYFPDFARQAILLPAIVAPVAFIGKLCAARQTRKGIIAYFIAEKEIPAPPRQQFSQRFGSLESTLRTGPSGMGTSRPRA